MPTAMVTFNGRITLPFQVRKQLGLKTGDNVDFVEVENGQFAIKLKRGSVMEMRNRSAKSDDASLGEELNPAIQNAAAENHSADRCL
jgi:antitoxin PrlF